MSNLRVEQLQAYLKETYRHIDSDQGLFMKLVEEVGEVAEILNIRNGHKFGDINVKEELAKELADVIHYAIAIAAVNDINLEKTIIEKDEKASIKYQHEINLKEFLSR